MGRMAWGIVVTALLVLSACGEDRTSDGSAGPTTSTSAGTPAAALAERLATNGDRDLFDHRYVADIGEDGVLFVGVEDSVAVAYACDPTAGSTWLTGTVQGDEIDLTSESGAALVGTIDDDALVATLTGAPSNNGEVVLAEDPAASIQREPDVPTGEVVGGLVQHGDAVRGTLGASSVGAKPIAGVTVGFTVSQLKDQISIRFAVPAAQVASTQRALSTTTDRLAAIRSAAAGLDETSELMKLLEEVARKNAESVSAEGQAALAALADAIVASAATGAALATSPASTAKIVPWAAAAVRDAVLRLQGSKTAPSTSTTTTTTTPSGPPPLPTMTVVALAP